MSNNFGDWGELISFGGSDTVTGSSHLLRLRVDGVRRGYLVDAGMFQMKNGRSMETNIAPYVDEIDVAFATHAHIDHIGRFPYLRKLGYRGPIYATEPVCELAEMMLMDSAKIQDSDYKQLLQKHGFKNKRLVSELGLDPLYTVQDVENVMEQFYPVRRGRKIRIDEYVEATFYNAGHGLGSSSILLSISNGYETYKILFSGDIGQNNAILKRRRDTIKKDIDLVVMESTYADRFHREREESWREVRELIATTILKGGNVVIPAFTVGRTQEILYLYYEDMVTNSDWIAEVFKRTPVFIDSNMAVQATQIFRKYSSEFKARAMEMMKNKENNPLNFPQLEFADSVEASKRITMTQDNYVVFSAAGMCNAGRVLYHLEKDLPNPNSAIIIPGFQAEGTLGRQLVDGNKIVKIHGKVYKVRAKVASINGFSGHVDQNGLKEWLKSIDSEYNLLLAHGDPEPQKRLMEELVVSGIVPEERVTLMATGTIYHLYKGGLFTTPLPDMTEKREVSSKKEKQSIEKAYEFIRTALEEDGPLDSSVVKVLNELEREIKSEKRRSKTQSKPNKSRAVRR